MRSWTTAVMRCTVPPLLASMVGACRSSPPTPNPPFSPPDTGLVALQRDVPPLRLIVGDTFRLVFRRGIAPRIAMTPGPDSGRATFVSSDPRVATVTRDGLVTAIAAGLDTIRVTSAAPQPAAPPLVIRVVTARMASNLMAMEVCPNVDSATVTTNLPLPPAVPPIHEYHDCQRLIANGRYQAPVGIFAHRNVAGFERWEDWLNGRLAAIIVDIGVKQERLSYPWLGIAPGTNCLVLKADSADRWRAAVISRRDGNDPITGRQRYSSCPESLAWADVGPADSVLVVRLQQGVDMNGDEVAPPVARWDWDSTHALNYIGVKCGARTWCEIGPPNFVPSRPLTMRVPYFPPIPFPYRTRQVLKGYYDQQLLADSTAKAPSTVFGTIMPGEDAKGRDDTRPTGNALYEVAILEFRETDATLGNEYRRYVRDYRDPGGPPPNSHRTSTRLHLRPTGSGLHYDLYEGFFNSKPLGPRGVRSRPHPGHLHGGPPVVRWRWVESDERTWTYCNPDGCCESMKVL